MDAMEGDHFFMRRNVGKMSIYRSFRSCCVAHN